MGFRQVNTTIVTFKEDGDEVVGKFVRKDDFDKGQLGDCQKYTFLTDEGKISCVCGSAFDKQFIEADIGMNTMVKIVYHGKKDIGGGKKVNLFDLFIDDEEEG